MTRKQLFLLVPFLVLILSLSACLSGGNETESDEASGEVRSSADRTKAPAVKGSEPQPADADRPAEPPPAASSADASPSMDEPADVVEPSATAPGADALRTPTTDYPDAPAEFRARFETTKGNFTVRLVRDWSPTGVGHFHHMVRVGYYSDIAFFRAIEGFMVQFGMHGDPQINELWANNNLRDDPVKVSNKRGYLTYAKTNLPNSRSTQLFINLADNPNLDAYGFSPIGEVVEGMSVVDSLYTGYGEGAPRGRGPSQMTISEQGNSYLKRQFPNLDYLNQVVLLD